MLRMCDERKYAEGELVPLTWQQRITWFENMLDPESARYNFYAVFHLEQAPDLSLARSQLSRALSRHAAMCVRVSPDITNPCQIVPSMDPRAVDVAVREASLNEASASSRDLIKAAGCDEPFDIAHGPLVRWTAVSLPGGQVKIVHAEHHLVHDGISFVLFLKSLLSPLADSPDTSYFHYASNQRTPSPQVIEQAAAELAGANLTRFGNGNLPGQAEDISVRIKFPEWLVCLTWKTARRLGVTPFTVLFSAFSHAIGELRGEDQFVIGTAVGNRPAGFEQTVGMFVATATVIIDHVPGIAQEEYVGMVVRRLSAAIEREVVPIPDLVRALGRSGRRARSVVSVAFSLFVNPVDDFQVGGSPATVETGVFNGASKFDLDVIAMISGRGPSGSIELAVSADGSRMRPADIEKMWTLMTNWLRRDGVDASC